MAGVHGRHVFVQPVPLVSTGCSKGWRKEACGKQKLGATADTVAEILNSIWTVQVIVFILPVLTFFPRRAKYVRTGCIRARPHRGDCRRPGPPSTSVCALQSEPA